MNWHVLLGFVKYETPSLGKVAAYPVGLLRQVWSDCLEK